MARISAYPKHIPVQPEDYWIGTRASNLMTRNFTAKAVGEYINLSGSISMATCMLFKFKVTNAGPGDVTGVPNETLFSNITSLQINTLDVSDQDTVGFLEYIVGTEIIISEQNKISTFGHYTINSYTQIQDTAFYTMNLTYIGGNGFIEHDMQYNICSFVLASEDTNTTYTLDSVQNGSNSDIRLIGSDETENIVKLEAGTNVTLTDTGSNILIDVTGLGTVTSIDASIDGNSLSVAGVPITNSGTIAFNWQGTNLQYVDGEGNLQTFPTIPTGTVTSVGQTHAGNAFSVAGSPITTSGVLAITLNGDATQYIDGAGDLQSFPAIPNVGDGTLTVQGTGVLDGTGTFTANQAGDTTISITHDNQSQTNTTPSTTLTHGGTFTALSANVSVNASGHVTGQELTTFTLPSDSQGVTSVNFKTDGTALNVVSNTITNSGTMTGIWQGNASQYVNGEGDLQTFPTIPVVPTNIVETIDTTNGTYIDLTPTTPETGDVIITADLSAVDGTGAPVGERYLSKNNKWETISSIPGTYEFSVDSNNGPGATIIESGDTFEVFGGTYLTGTLSVAANVKTIDIDHDLTSRTDTTSSDSPSYGGSFQAVKSVTTNATGHVTSIDVSTVTLPTSDDTTYDLTVPLGTTDITLLGSDASSDPVTLTGGTNIVVTRISDTEISIDGTDLNTTYDLEGVGSTNGTAGVRLTETGTSNYDDVLIVGTGTTEVTRSANTLTVTSNDQFTGTVISVDSSITGNAVSVSGVPITTSGSIDFDWNGTNLDYVDGEGNLQIFPTIPTVPTNIVETFSNNNTGTYVAYGVTNTGATGDINIGNVDLTAVDGTAIEGERYLTKSNTWATVASIPGTYNWNIAADSGIGAILSGDTVRFIGGANVTTSYDSGLNELTINSTDQFQGTVTSVATTHAGNAFTASIGNIATINPSVDITMNGSSAEYIDGAGNLQTFPTIPQGDITDVEGGTYITTDNSTGPVVTVNHDLTSRTDTASATTTSAGDTITAVDSVTTNTTGHVEAINLKSVTLPTGSLTSEVVDIQVKNISSANDGIDLKKGDPVYIYGSVGASARLYVDLADSDSTATNNLGDGKMPCVGLLDQDLVPNEEGTATVVGKLRNLITSPIDGVTPSENDTVYVKSGGGLTLTKPTGSTNLIQNVGQIGRVSTSSDGNIVVAALLRSNDVPNLPTGRIWVGDGNTIVSDTVYVDEPNNRVGIGTTNPLAKLQVNTGSDINAQFGIDSFGSFKLGDVANNYTGRGVFYSGSPGSEDLQVSTSTFRISGNAGAGIQTVANGDVYLNTSQGVLATLDDSTNNFGIGTTIPSQKLHVSGNARVTGAYYDSNNDPGTSGQILSSTVTGTDWIDGSAIPGVPAGSGTVNYLARWTPDANTLGIGVTYDNGTNVGIGTNIPNSKLQVDGEIDANGGDGYRINGKPWATENSNLLRLGDWDGEGFSTSVFDENSIEMLRVVDEGVIISSNFSKTPSYGTAASLLVGGSKSSPYGEGVLTLLNNDPTSSAGDQTGSIQFAIKDDSIGGYVSSSITGSINLPAGSGASGGGILDFNTSFGQTGSPLQTRMRINYNGNVGIGTTAPSSKLHSVTTVSGPIDYTQRAAILGVNDSTDITYANSVGVAGQVRTPGGRAIYGDTYGAGGWAGYFDGKGYFSGNVGIGTTSPDSKLEIEDSGTLGVNKDVLSITNKIPSSATINTTVGMNFNLQQSSNAAITYGAIRVGEHLGTGSIKGSMRFMVQNYSGGFSLEEKMRIESDGNVGIGATFPGSKLEVAGDTPSALLTLKSFNGGANDAFMRFYDESNGPSYSMGLDSTDEKFKIAFDYDGNSLTTGTKLVMDTSGSVGIGTTSPRAKLQVNGGVQLANDTASPSALKVGTFRYRTSGNNSYVDMCMQVGASSYAWVNIVTNSW